MTSRTSAAHDSWIMGIREGKMTTMHNVHQFGFLRCMIRTVYYWFRFPTGWLVSGHDYEEQADRRLVCRDCGRVSE